MDADQTLELRPVFDDELDAYHPKNRAAAKSLGLTYDPRTETYVDIDGFSFLDKYAQPLLS